MFKKIVGLYLIAIISLSANSFKEDMYLSGKIQAEGESAPGQNRFSAIRSARLDAQRNLLETIGGLQLTSSSKMKDGILLDDVVITQLRGDLRGAALLKKEYDKNDGSAIVIMGIGYTDSISKALAKAKETGTLEKVLYKDEKAVYYKNKIPAKQRIVNTAHDALIVDVRGLEFEPAQINRIYFNNKIIYDPMMVPADVISQRGLAKYTTTLNKAKAIAESYNSTNPLVVKALKTARLSSDIKISQEDAQKITSNNINKGFLESAKIVFIVE
ncbi:hypothetical protein [Sulfurimonas sp.]